MPHITLLQEFTLLLGRGITSLLFGIMSIIIIDKVAGDKLYNNLDPFGVWLMLTIVGIIPMDEKGLNSNSTYTVS
jgi:hypothetical protein